MAKVLSGRDRADLKQAVDTLTSVLHLKRSTEEVITSQFGRRGAMALVMLNHLLEHPFASVKDVEQRTGLSKKAAGDLVQTFVDHAIMEEVTGNTRNRLFTFGPYLDLFE